VRDVDQVQAVLERPAHGQRSRGGQADEGAEAGAYGFVDQFEAATAGDHDEALTRIEAFELQGADQLVEGVVAADVFAAQQCFAVGVEVQRRVQGTAAAGQLLGLLDALADAVEMRGGWQGCRGQDLQLRQRLLKGFHAAEAAAAGARHLPAMILQSPERAAGNLHVGLAGLVEMGQADVVDIVEAVDNGVAQAEAANEVLDVAR